MLADPQRRQAPGLADADLPLATGVDLEVTVAHGEGALNVPGQVVYHISIQNRGDSMASGIVIRSTIAHQTRITTTFDGTMSTSNWSCSEGGGDPNPLPTMACTNGPLSLQGGTALEVMLALNVTGTPGPTTQITNTVQVADDGQNGPDLDPSNNTYQDVLGFAKGVNLAVNVAHLEPYIALPGYLTYRIAYTNTGTLPATGVIITSTIVFYRELIQHNNYRIMGWSREISMDGQCYSEVVINYVGWDTLKCQYLVGSLAAGEAGSFSVRWQLEWDDHLEIRKVQINHAATIEDNGGNGPDLDMSNNSWQDIFGRSGDQFLDCDDCALSCWFEVSEGGAPSVGQSGLALQAKEPFDITVFRRVRDQVLSGSAAGPRYVDLYNTYTRDIVFAGLLNPSLITEGVSLLQVWQPSVQALVDGQGTTATISAAQVQALETYLDHLSSATGSAALRQAIAVERARTPPAQFVGVTMEETRTRLVGDYSRHLPVAVKGTMAAW